MRVLLRVDYASREDFAADVVTDLGVGGVFIRTDLELPVGTELTLSLSFPGLLAPTEVEGVVRWQRPPSEHVPSELVGVGVEFSRVGDEARTRIADLLSSLRRTPRPPQGGPFRVLLAEDNTFVSELFRHALLKFEREIPEYEGHQVSVARTGHEALRIIEESEQADVVILDHYLPGITGCALLRKMRAMEMYRHTPILMVSVGGPEIRKEALESGATLYLAKPVLLTQLLDTLRALVAREQASVS